MKEVVGKYNTAKVFTDIVDESSLKQVKTLCDQEFTSGQRIRLMPDIHAGAGCTIGTTMTIGDKIVPNLVGVDIGCFTKDTKVALADGRSLSFEELINEKDKEHYGYSIDRNGNVQVSKLEFPRKIKKADKLLEIGLDNGEKIKCTLDHIFYKRDCSEVEAKDLKVGDSLYPLYIKPAKDVFENSDDEHLCIFDGKISEYTLIHKLADAYNERHGLGVHFNGRGYVRHHKDFNKFNNNPTNIQRLLWEDHRKVHATNTKLTNKLGITGFAATERKHPGSAKRASIKRAEVTWNGPNAEINRKNAAKRLSERNRSEKMRAIVSKRQKEHNASKFSEHNKEEWMKNRQKLGRIRKVLLWLQDNNLEISEKNYNEARKNFYNYKFYKDAKQLVESLGLSFEKVLKRETVTNHKIVSIKEIAGDEVYCLTCQEFGNFALASGVFVHNCGMETLCIKADSEVSKNFDAEKLDKIIRKNIPCGFEINKYPHEFAKEVDWKNIKGIFNEERAKRSIGTLGGGNHFIEADRDEEGNLYIVVHSGSRHAGLEIAGFYQKEAFKQLNTIDSKVIVEQLKAEGREQEINETLNKMKQNVVPKDLAYVSGELFDNYINDMKIMQHFASLNRKAMIQKIAVGLRIGEKDIFDQFTTIHNYIDTDSMILRKGAVSAKKGEKLLIPINMRDGSLICVGKGNEDWNYSAPHGAGRIMSRAEAKKKLSLEEFKNQMSDVWSSSVNEDTLDEAPMAYKNIEDIVSNIGDTVEVIKTIKPIYNFKASE